jgi:PIN domain nuclease of toxin-antitoxin system
MKYLLDTHTLLWIVTDDKQLSIKAKRYFLNKNNEIYLSIASLWEMAIKISLDKLKINQSLNEFCKEHIIGGNIKILDIKIEHLSKLESLKFKHRDFFDRLLVCQSLVENIAIISKDKVFNKYSVKRIW